MTTMYDTLTNSRIERNTLLVQYVTLNRFKLSQHTTRIESFPLPTIFRIDVVVFEEKKKKTFPSFVLFRVK